MLTARRPSRAYLLSPLAFPSVARRPSPRRNPRASAVGLASVHSACDNNYVCLPDLIYLCRFSHPPPRASSTSCHAAAARAHPRVTYTSPVTVRTVAAGGPAPRALPPASPTIYGCTTMTMTTVVTVVLQVVEDALRLLDLERCTQLVDAQDRRRGAAQVDAARRLSVCRRVSERKDLSAAHECKTQQARVHLGRRVRARIDGGAAAPPARRGYIRGRPEFFRGGSGGERRRRRPGVVAAAATVPGSLPAGEVVRSSGHLDVCVRW